MLREGILIFNNHAMWGFTLNACACVIEYFSLIQVRSLLSTLQFSIINVPVKDVSDSLPKGTICHFDF